MLIIKDNHLQHEAYPPPPILKNMKIIEES